MRVTVWTMMSLSLLLVSCTQLENERLFQCANDTDCSAGWVCKPLQRERTTSVCVKEGTDLSWMLADGSDGTIDGDDTISDTANDTNTTTNDTTTNDTTVNDTNSDIYEPDPPVPGDPISIDWPPSVDNYIMSAAHVNYIKTLTIPGKGGGGPVCCRDWGHRSQNYIYDQKSWNDNSLIDIAVTLNLQTGLDDRLASGEIAILLDHREFNGATDDPDDLVLVELFGRISNGSNISLATSGRGSFVLDGSNFGTGGTPAHFFNPASMAAGHLSAGPSNSFHLKLPLGAAVVEVPLSEAVLEATGTFDVEKITYVNGTLSGYFTREDLVAALNEYLGSPRCACLGLSEPIYSVTADNDLVTACLANADPCTDPEEDGCRYLAVDGDDNICGIIPIVNTMADLDLDESCRVSENCDFEGISLGLQWTAVPATIVVQ